MVLVSLQERTQLQLLNQTEIDAAENFEELDLKGKGNFEGSIFIRSIIP